MFPSNLNYVPKKKIFQYCHQIFYLKINWNLTDVHREPSQVTLCMYCIYEESLPPSSSFMSAPCSIQVTTTIWQAVLLFEYSQIYLMNPICVFTEMPRHRSTSGYTRTPFTHRSNPARSCHEAPEEMHRLLPRAYSNIRNNHKAKLPNNNSNYRYRAHCLFGSKNLSPGCEWHLHQERTDGKIIQGVRLLFLSPDQKTTTMSAEEIPL